MKQTGGCHCGKVKFEVDMNLENAISCNCSICLMRGSLLDFAPESNFKLISGKEDLKDYTFNKHMIHHMFCKTCGILPFGKAVSPDGTPTVAINIRCVDGIDLKKINIHEYDGRSK